MAAPVKFRGTMWIQHRIAILQLKSMRISCKLIANYAKLKRLPARSSTDHGSTIACANNMGYSHPRSWDPDWDMLLEELLETIWKKGGWVFNFQNPYKTRGTLQSWRTFLRKNRSPSWAGGRLAASKKEPPTNCALPLSGFKRGCSDQTLLASSMTCSMACNN